MKRFFRQVSDFLTLADYDRAKEEIARKIISRSGIGYDELRRQSILADHSMKRLRQAIK